MRGCLNVIDSEADFIKQWHAKIDVPARIEKIKTKAVEAKESGFKVKEIIKTFQVLLLWESGELSEGQAAKELKIDRVSLRQLRLEYIEESKIF